MALKLVAILYCIVARVVITFLSARDYLAVIFCINMFHQWCGYNVYFWHCYSNLDHCKKFQMTTSHWYNVQLFHIWFNKNKQDTFCADWLFIPEFIHIWFNKTYETLQCLIYVFGFISELLHSWFDKNLPDSSLVKISGIEPQNVLFFMPGSVISEKGNLNFMIFCQIFI